MIVLDENRYSVFGSATFGGNPVTLFAVDTLGDDIALQRAAQRSSTEDNVFFTSADAVSVKVRFFSSSAELLLCGHGLLALARHLHAAGVSGARAVHSTHGVWQIDADAERPGVLMPAQRGSEVTDPAHWMRQALRSIGIEHARLFACPNEVWVAVLRDKSALLHIRAEAVAALPCGGNRPGALIAALSMPDACYAFRYFAPWHGKMEDGGTGSAHCYLAPLMAATSGPVTALQPGPGGVAEMCVSLRGDVVALSGHVERGVQSAG